MKKGIIKAVVLAIVFVAAVMLSDRFMNQNQIDLTTEMKEASLPIVLLYDEDMQMNELHGFTVPMSAKGMRETITPVSSNEEIPLLIKTYGCKIDQIAFEIRSIDGERLISDGTISSMEEADGQIRTRIPVQSLLEQSREYILILKLKQKEDTWHYYTRITDSPDCHVQECAKFVLGINEQTFSSSTDGLTTYWEPNAEGDNSTLHKVTINSSLAQAGWGDLQCDRLTQPVVSLREMNSSYNVILLDYVVTTTAADGALDYYNVEEYYRVRYTDDRMYLLNFERTMNQIFNGEKDFLYDNYLQLGIRSEEVEYMQNEAGTITCFVQEGDLWSYNQSTKRIAEVFSFHGHEGIDPRENYMQHDIKILSVDETGGIDYVVYGYMNRGEHEGGSGISVLHYDSQTNTNQELLFIAYDKSFDMLQAELGELLYENTGEELYLLFQGTVYRVNLETIEAGEIAENLVDGAYAISDSNRYVAWVSKGELEKAETITVMDLETDRVREIDAEDGKSLRILGFLQEDLVYGIASGKHEVTGATGLQNSPLYALRIVDASTTEVIKEYRKKGYYIKDVEFHQGVLIIRRLQKQDGIYVQAQEDSIVNRSQELEQQEIIHTTVTDVRQKEVQLTLNEEKEEKLPVYIAAKLVMNLEEKEIALKSPLNTQRYFAYAKGKAELATTDVSEAIRRADADMGVVVDSQQEYIWKRARKNAQQPILVQPSEADAESSSVAQCISGILKLEDMEVSASELLNKGDTPQEILESLLTDKKVLKLTGCELNQTFYYISCGTPVFAIRDASQAVLVTGYDSANVWLYDPLAGGVVKETIEQAEETFTAAGGSYLVYE